MRYRTARSDQSEAQQRLTAASTSSMPVTCRNVSYCPAKLASARSSLGEDERTATSASSPIAR
ncbi:hypothetical protein HNP84_002623 [Thermocatellispora tengchongensis]|uniref:Uncharacterized protein n=1 Tax=Thermocatellispora tengchongensis TaxID=1073253 RepID=A0A840P0J5_9ACTN|nr:hypothetical protein [Thermocatellispora tengchongensis]